MEFRRIIDLEIKEMDEVALEKSREWLNDPEIKELTMTPDFDEQSQKEWFKNLKTRTDYYIIVGWHEGQPISVGGLKHINGKDAELYGYIGDKRYWGKAVAVDMMNTIHEYGKSIGLESIYSIQLKNNLSSIKLNTRFGYKYEKDLDENRQMMRLQL